jgi:hypothetical protein
LVGNTEIFPGRSYRVLVRNRQAQTPEERQHCCIIYIHRIFQSRNATVLSVSKFLFWHEISLLQSSGTDDAARANRLLLSFTNWEHAGTEADAEELRLSDIFDDQIHECTVKSHYPNLENHRQTGQVLRADMAITISQFRDSRFRVEIRKLGMRSPDPATWPWRTPNGVPSVVDLYCGAGGSSAGFALSGMDILAGVEQNWEAASTWQVGSPGRYNDLVKPSAAKLCAISKESFCLS